MAWQNPKKNWVAGDIPGAGDFNRIEGNTEYLKGQTDGLKSGSIKAGNAVKLNGQSPSYYAKQADIDGLKNGSIKAGDAKLINGLPIYARIVPSDTVILSLPAERRGQGLDETVVKRFRLKYPGVYRVKAQMRGEDSSYTAYALFYVGDVLPVGEMRANSSEYVPVSGDIVVPGWGLTLTVKIRNYYEYKYTYIRDVQVCGTLTTAEPANPAVLQN